MKRYKWYVLIKCTTLFCVGFVCASSAWAYIPSAKTILSRTVKNNGKGAYIIEQDVIFRSLPDLPMLRERWTVVNGDAMRVSVTAPPTIRSGPLAQVKFDIVYRSGRRVGVRGDSGRVGSAPLPSEFFEPFSYVRSLPGISEMLIQAKLAPSDIAKPKPPIKNIAQYKYIPEGYVNLARTSGAVAWVIGDPTPENSTAANPAIWIEQDAFLIRRLRFPTQNDGSQVEIAFDNISNFPNGFKLARERTINWGSNQVAIRVLRARTMGESAAMTQIQSNPPRDNDSRMPDLPALREFYSRFR